MKMHNPVGKLKKRNDFLNNFPYLLLALPAILYLFIFNYLPMFGAIMAFKDYTYRSGIFGSPWAGWRHFQYFFTSNDAVRILRNTILYNLWFMLLIGVVGGAVIALLLYEVKSRMAVKVYQTSMLLPFFLSWVVLAGIAYLFLNPTSGLLNVLRQSMGLEKIMWYSEPKYWPVILTVCEVWKTIGMASLYFYAALLAIDPCLFEAASLDGAGKLKQMLHISIPELMPMVCITIITRLGGVLGGEFGLYYQIPMDSGALYPATDVLGTYLYRGLASGNFSATAAVGLFQSVVGLILVLISNSIIRKISPDNAMF